MDYKSEIALNKDQINRFLMNYLHVLSFIIMSFKKENIYVLASEKHVVRISDPQP